MKRSDFEAMVTESFGTAAERPFMREQSTVVFRHEGNRKWFAVVMTIPKRKLGILEEGNIDIVNLKCAPEMLDSLWQESGIYPAYHMSRSHWISATLDGRVPPDTLRFLLGVSFELTSPSKKR